MEGLDKSKSHSSLIGVSLNKYEATRCWAALVWITYCLFCFPSNHSSWWRFNCADHVVASQALAAFCLSPGLLSLSMFLFWGCNGVKHQNTSHDKARDLYIVSMHMVKLLKQPACSLHKSCTPSRPSCPPTLIYSSWGKPLVRGDLVLWLTAFRQVKCVFVDKIHLQFRWKECWENRKDKQSRIQSTSNLSQAHSWLLSLLFNFGISLIFSVVQWNILTNANSLCHLRFFMQY